MNPRNHPSASLLTEYAGGDLAFAPAIAVSAHLETCPACQVEIARFEAQRGADLERQTPFPMSADALDHTLAHLDDEVPPDEAEDFSGLGDVALPKAIRQAGLGARRWMGSELWAAPVHTSTRGGWRAFLLRMPAGTRIPAHGHKGQELVAVLAGGFHDGAAFAAGDFAESGADRRHRLTVDSAGPCVCLIAVQGRLQWRGWARVITPLLGV